MEAHDSAIRQPSKPEAHDSILQHNRSARDSVLRHAHSLQFSLTTRAKSTIQSYDTIEAHDLVLGLPQTVQHTVILQKYVHVKISIKDTKNTMLWIF